MLKKQQGSQGNKRFDENTSVADMGITFDTNGKAILIKEALDKKAKVVGKLKHINTMVQEEMKVEKTPAM